MSLRSACALAVIALAITVSSASMSFAAAPAAKPKGRVIELKAQVVQPGAAGATVRGAVPPNRKGATMPAPPAKGGPTPKGVLCMIKFDNWTQYRILCYADNELVGVVAPYGDIEALLPSGATSVFAAAMFDDGSILKWGPENFSCDGEYTWKLK